MRRVADLVLGVAVLIALPSIGGAQSARASGPRAKVDGKGVKVFIGSPGAANLIIDVNGWFE